MRRTSNGRVGRHREESYEVVPLDVEEVRFDGYSDVEEGSGQFCAGLVSQILAAEEAQQVGHVCGVAPGVLLDRVTCDVLRSVLATARRRDRAAQRWARDRLRDEQEEIHKLIALDPEQMRLHPDPNVQERCRQLRAGGIGQILASEEAQQTSYTGRVDATVLLNGVARNVLGFMLHPGDAPCLVGTA